MQLPMFGALNLIWPECAILHEWEYSFPNQIKKGTNHIIKREEIKCPGNLRWEQTSTTVLMKMCFKEKQPHVLEVSRGWEEGERMEWLCLIVSMQWSTGFRFSAIVLVVSLGRLNESRGRHPVHWPSLQKLAEASQKKKQMGVGKDSMWNRCYTSIHQVLTLIPKSGDTIPAFMELLLYWSIGTWWARLHGGPRGNWRQTMAMRVPQSSWGHKISQAIWHRRK